MIYAKTTHRMYESKSGLGVSQTKIIAMKNLEKLARLWLKTYALFSFS